MQSSHLRILIISNYFPPYVEGGYEVACAQTADYLASQGHSISVLTGNAPCDNEMAHRYPVERDLLYIDYREGGWRQKMAVEYHNYQRVSQVIAAFRPDLVYFWNLKGLSTAPIFAARHASCKYVFEMGDDWAAAYLKPGPLAWLKRAGKTLLTRGRIGLSFTLDPCIVVSEWFGRRLAQRYGADRCFCIPNGTRLPQQRRSIRSAGPTRFLLAGRLVPEKGVDLVIDAASELLLKGQRDFQISMVGPCNPDYRQTCIDRIHSLGLASWIQWYPVTDAMDEVYRAHDVLLMPTHTQEPFGLVLIEAMAHELAVVATRGYGPSEIIEHEKDGLLVERHSVNALTDAMARLMTEVDLRRQLARQGRIKVSRHYDIRKVKARVEAILQAIVATPV